MSLNPWNRPTRRNRASSESDMHETSLSWQIVLLLRKMGLPAWLTHDSMHRPAEKGISDVHAILPRGKRGVLFSLEVKKPDGKTSLEREVRQEAWQAWVASSGAITHTVTSLEEVRDIVVELMK